MIDIVLNVPGQMYQEAITGALEQTGNFRVWPLERRDDTAGQWKTPELVLLGVSVQQGFTLGERKNVIRELKEKTPQCRIVLFIDELVSQEQTEGVKNMKQAKLIDGFLYASVTMEYLVATLESI